MTTGKRGPKKTPTEELEARGSWRAKGRPGTPVSEKLRCPSVLGEEEKKAWRYLIPKLKALSKIDEFALERYCTLWCKWRIYERNLRDVVALPEAEDVCQLLDLEDIKAAAIVRELRCREVRRWEMMSKGVSDQLLRLELQFGMTPASRLDIGTANNKDALSNDRSFLKEFNL